MYMPAPTKDFEEPPEGSHAARCYRVVDLGTQEVEWEGKIKHQHKVLIGWELHCDERMQDGRPFSISKRYTLSSSDKGNFRKDLEAWRGKRFEDSDFGPGGFNIKNLINVPCLLSLARSEKGGKSYTNVVAIMKPPKGMEIPALENETVFLSLEKSDWNAEVFGKLSDGLKETIRKSPEFAELTPPDRPVADNARATSRDDLDSDIPF